MNVNIRLKIILIVVPLIITTLALTGLSSFFSATNAITRIAKDFLGFKSDELSNQAQSQWGLLVDNNLSSKPEMITATKAALGGYAQSIIRSPTELILAFDKNANVVMSTSTANLLPSERPRILSLIASKSMELTTLRLDGKERVAKGFWFDPFGWYMMVTEERGTFYNQVNEITQRSAIILGAAILLGVILMLLFADYLTRPLTRVKGTMKKIIDTNDLSQRVTVEYKDEVGDLAQTFNLMVGAVERANVQIKMYAYHAVVARKQEQKVRNIFQKYVPAHVIDEIFKNPDGMLVGKNASLSILFSDVRGFTTISEKLRPRELVENLNRYFEVMVDVITGKQGIIDKYEGDAIMAFFGAPVESENVGLQSVTAGLEMLDGLVEFNRKQRENNNPEFQIGIGINFGDVILGNMGAEKKLDYTVMGDNVNLASRLEGLTKQYKQKLIISESLKGKIDGILPYRMLDMVAVKGKTQGVRIYSVKRALEAVEKEAWAMHNAAMLEYFPGRNFGKAAHMFEDVGRMLTDDFASAHLRERCLEYEKNPPAASWDGVEVMKTK
ncbi:MAG TPA: adenylate/guanylate cyclase domain-containing protein [Spirochaetia bacterium]|nr:adenylate/guanylate cyclase domain-containing protein [Spirochaetia bacterium]